MCSCSSLLCSLRDVFAVLAQLAFRWVTYGDYVPKTAHAKLAMSWHRL